jgi:hypothetical protein
MMIRCHSDMADFATWQQPTLAAFAADMQAERRRHLEVMRYLIAEYERVCSEFCIKPERHEAYRVAKEVVS